MRLKHPIYSVENYSSDLSKQETTMLNQLNVKIFDETVPNQVDEQEINAEAVVSEKELIKANKNYYDSSSQNSRRPIIQRNDIKSKFL